MGQLNPDDLAAAALRPASTAVDGVNVTERPLADQIALDRYLRSIQSTTKKRTGLRFFRVRDPGMPGAQWRS